MAWLQLIIQTSPDQSESLEDALLGVGALSITYRDNADQPILEPALGETPLWRETAVIALFEAGIESDPINQELSANFKGFAQNHRWEIIEDKDWEREWMQHYHPIHCGDNLWICPSWIDPPEPQAVNVLLDPGLAFGTGTHPTTLLCLQWLAKQDVSGKTIIDYGCGSGILGIAALLLGAKKVFAIDIDPQALLATRDNAGRNGIDLDAIETFLPENLPQQAPLPPADLVFANILAGPLVALAPTLIALAKPKASLCLSGILSSQGHTVVEAYLGKCRELCQCRQEEWLQIALERI